MGASSSCCFCIAKAEESPCTEADDGVAELNPRSTAERASSSGRTAYYSARCEAMKRSRGQFSDDVSQEIEFSKSHWSEVVRPEVAPQSTEEEELNRENRELLKLFKQEYPLWFFGDLGDYVLGRMIAKGGQAEIYEVVGEPDYLLKVFERGTSLRDLRRSWPRPILEKDVLQCILRAGMLEDGRFALLMHRRWGDLRKLIDQAMLEKNADGIQGSPFPYDGWERGNGWNLHPADFMLGIAQHMRDLHEKGVSHRDLKASNILLGTHITQDLPALQWVVDVVHHLLLVADFECSIGVLGTGYWRAPEILEALGNASTITNEQWKKADVYSYGMTCLEIVTGQIPFDGELENTKAHRELVIEGKRPQLPSDLDEGVKDLITKCWASDPSLRPTFSQIVDLVETICKRQCEFRLFRIGDELPPNCHLATVQEVNEYPIALTKAMPWKEIANLVDGSVDVQEHQYDISLEKQSNVYYKLARLQH